ncbi:MAG TPA: hypothetical protein VEP12_03845 [Candidatus Acidoferrum sp.]|nr:hypothetical protein [Candidatus Acidoferrum sp.]
MALIPDRSTSRYAGHYARAIDPQRLLQIFSDSHRIALKSQDPSTARARFELAVEAYHQLTSMTLPMEMRVAIQGAMIMLAGQFPVQMCLNEALGLCAKARKLKTARRQLEYLKRAREILLTGLATSPEGAPAIQATYDCVLTEITEVEAIAHAPRLDRER